MNCSAGLDTSTCLDVYACSDRLQTVEDVAADALRVCPMTSGFADQIHLTLSLHPTSFLETSCMFYVLKGSLCHGSEQN